MTKQTIKATRVGASDLHKIPPADIHVVEGFNVRNHDAEWREHIDELKASISENGVLEPLTVRYSDAEDQIELRHGHCRLTAVMELIQEGAEIEWVPCQTEGRNVSAEASILQIAIRNDGKPLRPIEVAQVYLRLSNFGWSQDQIAKKVGKTGSHVSGLLRLATGPERVQRAVREGKVSASLASQAIRDHGQEAPAVVNDAIAKAESEGKTKATARHVGNSKSKSAIALIDALQQIAGGAASPRTIATQALQAHGIAVEHPGVDEYPDTPAFLKRDKTMAACISGEQT